MAITKTTAFSEMKIQATKQVTVFMIDTLDDPDDNTLPAHLERAVVVNPGADLSQFPSAVQTIIQAAWDAL